jgi:hypothetical protein
MGAEQTSEARASGGGGAAFPFLPREKNDALL